jgi:hypothetical protein
VVHFSRSLERRVYGLDFLRGNLEIKTPQPLVFHPGKNIKTPGLIFWFQPFKKAKRNPIGSSVQADHIKAFSGCLLLFSPYIRFFPVNLGNSSRPAVQNSVK